MLDVLGSRELQAALLAVRQARREIKSDISKDARNAIRPLWQKELDARARTRMEQAVILGGARANVAAQRVRVTAARGRTLRGGLDPKTQWAGVEFGARPVRVEVRQRSRQGRVYTRRLWIQKQFKTRKPHGMIAYDAASAVGTELVGIWVRTIVDVLRRIPGAEVTR